MEGGKDGWREGGREGRMEGGKDGGVETRRGVLWVAGDGGDGDVVDGSISNIPAATTQFEFSNSSVSLIRSPLRKNNPHTIFT